jgi:aminoglycoside phosphotransferase (APT) family kinase protein
VSTEPKGIAFEKVSAWLESALPDYPPPYEFDLIAAGGSNLTYKVTAGNGSRFVLRRPPVTARVATAHDMQREYRIMSALKNTAVPVPAMLAYCSEVDLSNGEFYCMELVDGLALREQIDCEGMTAEQCAVATESLVDAQVAFHQIDLAAVGLSDMAKHDGYLERQLKRWNQQIVSLGDQGGDQNAGRDLRLFAELHARLSASVPESQQPPGLAHGDYRFDNCILNPDYTVAAVLDWELCTIGDPIADFVWSLNYWAEPGEELTWLLSPPTRYPAFVGRQAVIDQYCEKSGIELGHLDWYHAFSWWKQACIVEGVLARLRQGGGGGMKVEALDAIGTRIEKYLVHSDELLEGKI